MASSWTFFQICGAVGLVCAAWNLFGDLYLLDFYTAHLSDQEIGMIRDDLQPGYLFQFDKSWMVFLAQSGSWMYPVWAFVTAAPLCMGLRSRDNHWKNAAAPVALLVYGILIMGGALHNACVFPTVLPIVYHSDGWSDLKGEVFSLFLAASQTRIIQHIAVGSFPGYVACNVASIWIAVIVHCRDTQFPKWFNLFNPIVTLIWVQALGALLPDPWGFYFVGCLGTWGLLVFNVGTTFVLWNDGTNLESLASSNLLLPKGEKGEPVDRDYNSMQH